MCLLDKGGGVEGGLKEEERASVNVYDRRGSGEYLVYIIHHVSHAEKHDRLDSLFSI